jgi:hypothetical protein
VESTLVSDWFGKHFARLHPALQHLHRSGGTLSGPVDVHFEPGVRGILGRWLAKRFRIPLTEGPHALVVTISHDAKGLHWNRCFDGDTTIASVFEPVSRLPDGYWVERTGRLTMLLTVDTDNGGWQWRPIAYRCFGVRLPLALLPRISAGKWIAAGKYRFSVIVTIPLLGKVLSYTGLLELRGQTPESVPD